jgi:glucokinase
LQFQIAVKLAIASKFQSQPYFKDNDTFFSKHLYKFYSSLKTPLRLDVNWYEPVCYKLASIHNALGGITMAREASIIGIDVGGTNIKLGLLTPQDEVYFGRQFETRSYRPRDTIVADIIQHIKTIQQEALARALVVNSLGVGVPATIDVEKNATLIMPNFAEGWFNFQLANALTEKTGLAAFVVNDARSFVLAESLLGAGRGFKHMFGVILGTGVGGGFVLDGKLQLGKGWAGEFGHFLIDPNGLRCGCGSVGCLETVASASALVASTVRPFLHGRTPVLHKLAKGDLNAVSAQLITDAARRGDEGCLESLDKLSVMLGMALASVATLLAPERIIIGGGLSKATDLLLPGIYKSFEKHAKVIPELPSIVVAELENPGVIGAALYARSMLKNRMTSQE